MVQLKLGEFMMTGCWVREKNLGNVNFNGGAFSAVVGSLFSAAHLSFHKSVGAFYFILLITPYVVVN